MHLEKYVSIHAPREGCDREQKSVVEQVIGFNSRTPGGVRQERAKQMAEITSFQFTHPGRGATSKELLEELALVVSIHAPREGCDFPERRP